MVILLLGSGGREHAFAWKLSQSKKLTKLFIAPGNAGTSAHGENVDLNPVDFASVKKFVLEKKVEMVVVGPEDPLVKGIRDFFLADADIKHIPVIGPSAEGAKLEGSKEFAKAFMKRNNVPTAAYESFTKENISKAYTFLEKLSPPYVIKADGLAAGKGVVISGSLDEAKQTVKEMLEDAKFGEASSKVVIEEFLHGIELSVFVLTDGVSYRVLPAAKDYKRIGENDTGLNTGGMGAVSPVPFADASFLNKVQERVVIPTIEGLKKEKIDYQGFVFIGLMNCNGDPYVIEYNCRMGDPETEVVLPRIKTDLVDLFSAVAETRLKEVSVEVDDQYVVTVVAVSGGYPEKYKNGKVISGFDRPTESVIFHAGTKSDNGNVVTAGGRVLAVTSRGSNIEEALRKSYETLNRINYEDIYYRKDIGKDLIRFTK